MEERDPLHFKTDTIVLPGGAHTTSTVLEAMNMAHYAIRFEIRTTHPENVFARPVGGVVAGRSSRGLEIVACGDRSAIAGAKVQLQYRVDEHEVRNSLFSTKVWTKKFPISLMALSTPSIPQVGLLKTPTLPEADGGPADLVKPRGGLHSIEVFARLRPLLREFSESPTDGWRVKDNKIGNEEATYTFDGILFPHCTNADTFEACKLPQCMADVLSGANCTFFAYGHTGSGKTHTILGTENDRGIAQRCVEALFQRIDVLSAPTTAKVSVSFFEVYSEDIYDLLGSTTIAQKSSLPLRGDKPGGFTIVGLSERVVHSASQAMLVLEEGSRKRRIGVSHVNERSSRSHCVFRIHTTVSYPRGGVSVTHKGEANIVDLAGSEAISDDAAVDRRETTSINLSLLNLKKVIAELSRKEKFISYRNSTLTKVLKQALGGNSRTILICNATLSEQFYRETKATLQFGTLAKTVSTTVMVHEAEDKDQRLLEEENERLRQRVQELEQELDVQRQRSASGSQSAPLPQGEVMKEGAKVGKVSRSTSPSSPDRAVASTRDGERASEKRKVPHTVDKTDQRKAVALHELTDAKAIHEDDDSQVQLLHVMAQTLTYLANGTLCLFHKTRDNGAPAGTFGPSQGVAQLDFKGNQILFTPNHSADGTQSEGRPSTSSSNLFSDRSPLREAYHLSMVEGFSLRTLTHGLPPWICLSMRSQLQPTGPYGQKLQLTVVNIACRTSADHECWMVCLCRMLKRRPQWLTSMVIDRTAPLGPSGEGKLSEEEYDFCEANHIEPSAFYTAREFIADEVSSGRPVSILNVRNATESMFLHEAELLCEYFVQIGALAP